MATEATGGLGPAGARAVRRWKLGHHVFHLQMAVMTTLLDEAVAAARDRPVPASTDLGQLLGRLADLYDAATATMRFAADFDPGLYETLIRPSMAPPHLSPGFSGLLNQEHELMLARLRTLRSLVEPMAQQEGAPESLRRAADRLWAAQVRNRRHHTLVCDRFVPGGRSLLKQFFGQERTRAAAVAVPD